MQLPLLLENQLKATPLLEATPLSPSIPSAPTLPPPTLPLASEQLLGGHVASMPPGQIAASVLAHVSYFQQHFKNLDVQQVGCGLVRGMASTVQLFSILLSNAPLAVWTGRSKVTAMDSTHLLVELVSDVIHGVWETTHPFVGRTLHVTVLLLASLCCQQLTRLSHALPPTTPLPGWPLDWTGWVGVVSSWLPAAQFLLVRGIDTFILIN